MRLNKSCISTTIAGLALLTGGTVTVPANAAPTVQTVVSQSPPPNTIIGGKDIDGSTLYVCTVVLNEYSAQPGKLVLYKGKWGCNYGYGGHEYRSETPGLYPGDFYTHAVEPPLEYKYAQSAPSPNAFRPLEKDSDGSTLYYCNANYKDNQNRTSIQVGKAVLYKGVWGCNFGYGGKEARVTSNFNYLWIY